MEKGSFARSAFGLHLMTLHKEQGKPYRPSFMGIIQRISGFRTAIRKRWRSPGGTGPGWTRPADWLVLCESPLNKVLRIKLRDSGLGILLQRGLFGRHIYEYKKNAFFC
jgi:hypothetical protein